jgi:hypothetical protein
MSDKKKHTANEYERLKKKLAIEEGKSLIKAYPDYPRDKEGNIIGKKTSETVGIIAGKGHPDKKTIRQEKMLVEKYGGKPGDWVKLSSPTRDIRDTGKDGKPVRWEVHGYKKTTTGEVKKLKAVDKEKRRQEQISSHKKTNMDKSFKENKKDITRKEDPKLKDLKSKFNETKKETVTDKRREQLVKDFRSNAKEMTEKKGIDKKGDKKGDPPPKAELKPKFDKPRP